MGQQGTHKKFYFGKLILDKLSWSRKNSGIPLQVPPGGNWRYIMSQNQEHFLFEFQQGIFFYPAKLEAARRLGSKRLPQFKSGRRKDEMSISAKGPGMCRL
ncbi:hypothetical protein NE237_021843 [Protea cynaroides]|uniref:Uncharacterized protein n=1 Tax=Protea cynaroides TaxID=273540 RepID=A0A9Q0H9A4_9MAGN|nr:hypothetical protein NE237_021843 [Protea cynaroides]